MKRFFIELSYNGTNYCGWQIQNNAPTVELVIEQSLTKICGQPIDVVGCGRTDAGVHAMFYIAHFEIDTPKEFDDKFIYHLNSILPKDVAVKRIYPSEKHARFDAKNREYKYYICRQKPIFNDNVWHINSDLNYQMMDEASQVLMKYEDFTSFAKVGSDNKTNLCKINHASWRVDVNGDAVFTIAADRFLRGMVRGIVGTLVDVGRGKISVDQFGVIIEAKNRAEASSQAPAKGLFLSDAQY